MAVWPREVLSISDNGPLWARERAELEARLGQDGWFHSLTFENGAETFGRDPSQAKLRALQLPTDLSGYSLLDVGCYEGFFSFHAAQRGARVTANDHFIWHQAGDPSLEHFRVAHEVVGNPCEVVDLDVMELSVLARKWDIVLFLGVLYHLADPVTALRVIRSVTGRLCILETLVDCLDVAGERCAFYRGLNRDDSNYFGPNISTVVAMAERAGYGRVEVRNMWEVNTVDRLEGGNQLSPVRSGRVVCYLYV